MVSALGGTGGDPLIKKVAGGYSVLVPVDKVYSLSENGVRGKGVPHEEGVGFEIFDKSNLGISGFVQKSDLTRVIQVKLSRRIG